VLKVQGHHSAREFARKLEEEAWTITASAGLALTNGNSDTSTVNAAYDLVFDPGASNIVKTDGLFLRGVTEGEPSSNRLSLNARDEYHFSGRFFAFGQTQYLRDEFKDIEYLVAPTAGLGYDVVDVEGTKLGIDASAGGVWEKSPDDTRRSSGALTFGQRLTHTLTETTTVTEQFKGLWKTRDFEDSLLTLGVSIAASISARTQLKFEVLDTYKNKPRLATTTKHDVAVLMAIVYKM
jgi:putative salt-induced outer membrane protein YdiY